MSLEADKLSLNILNLRLLVLFWRTESKEPIAPPSRVYSMRLLHETQMIFGHKLFSFLVQQDCIWYCVEPWYERQTI